jgi:hypothetical protein
MIYFCINILIRLRSYRIHSNYTVNHDAHMSNKVYLYTNHTV